MTSYNWASGNGGSWNTGTLWTPSAVPTAIDSATIAVSAGYAVLIDGNDAIASLVFNAGSAELDIGGNFIGTATPAGTLTLGGTFDAMAGGTVIDGELVGGVVEDTGGRFGFVNGTLSGVTWDGTLNIFAEYNNLNVTNGLTLLGAGGVGPGALSMTGSVDTTYLMGTETLDNASVLLSGTADTLQGDTLTFGPSLTVTNSANANAIFTSGLLTNAGSIVASGGALTLNDAGGIANTGQISVGNGATLTLLGSVSGAGGLSIGAGGTMVINAASGGAVNFTGTGGLLSLSSLGAFSDGVGGIGTGNTIDVTGTVADSATLSGGTLDLYNGVSLVGALSVSGVSGGHFLVASDGDGGTDINYTLACFATGTRIATSRGPRAVEDIEVGEFIVTHDGARREAVWIGHRTVDCSAHPRPAHVWPVRVRAGAFGEGRPSRDLMLSPDHAVFIDDVLVPVRELIDGEAIAQLPVDRVTYWHIELETHDVILAEDLPTESFLDSGNRSSFANGGGVTRLHPEFAAAAWEEACAPLLVHGKRLDAIREALRHRRAHTNAA